MFVMDVSPPPGPPKSGLGENMSADRTVRMCHGERRCPTRRSPRSPRLRRRPRDFRAFIGPGAPPCRVSGPLIAGGQRIDVRIVEKSVVAVPPRVGLWREGVVSLGVPLYPKTPACSRPGCQGLGPRTFVRMRRWW